MTSAMRWDPHCQSFEKAEENALDKAGDIMCVESNNNSSIKIKLNSYPYITGGAEAQMERSVMSNNTRMVSSVMMDPGGNFDLFLDEYSLEVNDNLLGLKDSVSFSHGESSIRHCCEKSSGSVIGECCEECVGLERELSAVATTNRKCVVSPGVLGHRWGIGTAIASNVIDVTTQLGIRRVKHPVERRFRTSQPHLRKKSLCGRFYSDTCFFKCKSIRGDTCAQITGNGKGFCRFWSMKTKSLAHEGLRNFIEMDGIPENLVVDGSKEQSHNAWKDTLRTYHVNQSTSEPYSPWQNRAESEIKMIKIGIKKFTLQCNSPRSVWCYLGELISKLRRVTPSLIPSLGGRTPYEDVMGSTSDISALIQFRWWDLV